MSDEVTEIKFSRKEQKAAARILVQHDASKRYIPVDVRDILEKVAGDCYTPDERGGEKWCVWHLWVANCAPDRDL
jgi:hypothetical protein